MPATGQKIAQKHGKIRYERWDNGALNRTLETGEALLREDVHQPVGRRHKLRRFVRVGTISRELRAWWGLLAWTQRAGPSEIKSINLSE